MSQANQPSSKPDRTCPDCESGFEFLTLREFFNRRDFVKSAGAAAATLAAGAIGLPSVIARAAEAGASDPKNTAAAAAAQASGTASATKLAPKH